MKKSTRYLFKIASIITYITAGLLALLSMMLLFEDKVAIDAFASIYNKMAENPTPAGLEQLIFSYSIFTAFAAYMSFSAGRMYKLLSNASQKAVLASLKTLGFVSVFQLVYGLLLLPPLTLIAPIFGMIAYFQTASDAKKKRTATVPTVTLKGGDNKQSITVHPQAVQAMINKISDLKSKKEKGMYTDEQYNLKLSKILGGELE